MCWMVCWHIFTRLFGRLKGGPAYVNTAISSALGCMSGGNTPNAATAVRSPLEDGC